MLAGEGNKNSLKPPKTSLKRKPNQKSNFSKSLTLDKKKLTTLHYRIEILIHLILSQKISG